MTNEGSFAFHFATDKNQVTISNSHPITFYFSPGGLQFLTTSTYLSVIGDPDEWIVSIDEWIPSTEMDK